jgi:phosphate transport system permease protein
MATGSGKVIESFGEVNKTVGRIFQYVLTGATAFGIVVLAALLVFVANDALQPLTADPGWHLTFFVTLVVPTVAVGTYAYRQDQDALTFGVMIVGLLVVSLMFSAGVAMVLIDIISPIVWAGVALALVVPAALVVVLQRYSRRIPFFPRFGAAVVLFYVSLFGVPGPLGAVVGLPTVLPSVTALFGTLPVLPSDGLLVAGFLGVPIALAVGGYFRGIRGTEAGRPAAGVALAVTVLGGLVGPFVGVDPIPATAIAAVAIGPTAAYAVGGAVSHPEHRSGLLIPAVAIGGAILGAFVVETVGFAGPQSWVDWQFLTSAHSRNAVDAGLYPAIGGSILLMVTVAVLAFPLGVGAAIYLEEYAPDNRFTRFIDVNISNLAGVPSVVYGLLGLGVFVTYLGRPTGTVAIGGATLALLILPIVIISSREAIRSVPNEQRQASYGMGATKWQTVRRVVLPNAFPGILTGTILALGRAIGETAPLIMIGAPSVVFSLPTEFSAKASAMPLQVFAWASLFASEDFYTKAVPAGVVVLVSVLLAMNSIAIVLRNRYQSNQ